MLDDNQSEPIYCCKKSCQLALCSFFQKIDNDSKSLKEPIYNRDEKLKGKQTSIQLLVYVPEASYALHLSLLISKLF